MISLFSIINEQELFLAGDSAQTIATGGGNFKFSSLKSSFKTFPLVFDRQLSEPSLMQLTINFRSHNKIL